MKKLALLDIWHYDKKKPVCITVEAESWDVIEQYINFLYEFTNLEECEPNEIDSKIEGTKHIVLGDPKNFDIPERM